VDSDSYSAGRRCLHSTGGVDPENVSNDHGADSPSRDHDNSLNTFAGDVG
jgi:hypothetical protein